MNIALLILEGITGIAFGLNGLLKILRKGPSVAHFEGFRYPRWFLVTVGFMELLVGVGMLAGFWVPFLLLLGSILLIIVMVGAIFTHLVRKRDTFIPDVFPATIGLIIAIVLTTFTALSI
ncbi:DoxX family protein [Tengunoibacter tsumagoiensis]|uniref:DoxX family protein n=1 Tax=Tengunoibacter tsumagoiensis TaxID=2014871 RepID=A0A401ZYN6_9CHLR|nr:DoxX family protein [Tengunoibacter tsumagoiensis]GCE11950.1 hypothetical protein KTT_18090 [Tengunoibacter tsumagoiensis]